MAAVGSFFSRVSRADRTIVSPTIQKMELGKDVERFVMVAGSAFTRPETVVPLFLFASFATSSLGNDALVSRAVFCLCAIALTQMISVTIKTTVRRPGQATCASATLRAQENCGRRFRV